MKAFHEIIGWRRAMLLCTALIVLATSAAAQTEQEEGESPAPGKARMNVVFLDDSAEGLPAGKTVRYNHWPEWDARVPTFQKLLRTFIADFHKAQGQQPAAKASLYALEVSAGLKAANRDRHIADYLAEIAEGTKRATLVLARSTAGTDQLRLLYVLEADCPSRQAASFLAALAEVTPPMFHGRIGERFGPFRAPPTIIFDPRADSLSPVPAKQKARHRWGLLEEKAYLLPHYVLHAIGSLHEASLTMLADRTLAPGSALNDLATTIDKMQQQREMGNFREANTLSLTAMRQTNVVINLYGGTHNLDWLTQNQHDVLKRDLLHTNSIFQATKNDLRGAETLGNFFTGGLTGHLTGGVRDNFNEMNHLTMRINDHAWTDPGDSSLGNISLTDGFRQMYGQQFEQSLDLSRKATFGGPLDPKLGGVLFEHDNEYRVDLAGRLAGEIAEDRRQGRGTGPLMGRPRYFDDLPLLWLDVAASRNGSLPVAVPRFLTAAAADALQGFGGPWTFEPLTQKVHRNTEGRLTRATVTPAETQTRVSYMPLNLVVKDAPPVWVARNGTGFEPALKPKEDGRFVWTLRHGVEIEFGEDGLVDAIRSPHGEHITYLRKDGGLVGQHTSDGRRIDIQYAGNRPETTTLDRKPRVAYEYHADYWLLRVRGDREWSIGYDPKVGRPSQITSPSATTLSLTHDDNGRLTAVQSGPISVGIEYLQGTNTLRLSSNGQPTTDWLLGPISGPVMPDRAVLLTRSIAGRILQVSKGPVQGTGETRKFKPTETIALVR